MDYVTIPQAAKILACSESAIMRICKSGIEGPRKIGRDWVLPRPLVESLTVGPPGRPRKPQE